MGSDDGPPTRYSRRQVLAGGIALAGAGFAGGCSSKSTTPPGTTTTAPGATTTTSSTVAPAGSDLGAVEHVVFLMQENRSFDHYFGTYRGVRGFDDRSAGALATFEQAGPGGASAAPALSRMRGRETGKTVAPGSNCEPGATCVSVPTSGDLSTT